MGLHLFGEGDALYGGLFLESQMGNETKEKFLRLRKKDTTSLKSPFGDLKTEDAAFSCFHPLLSTLSWGWKG